MAKFLLRTIVLVVLISALNLSVTSQIAFPTQSSYHYLKGSAASTLVSTWMNPDFDDSAWSTANSPFRYGDGTGGFVLTDMIDTYTTVYLRSTFEASNIEEILNVNFNIDYDDGFVVWINGEEVLDVNAPASYAYDETAPDNHESGVAENFNVSINDLNLNEGTNTIAIQGFNYSLTSSDFFFDVGISAIRDLPLFPDSIGINFSHNSGYFTDVFSLNMTSQDPEADVVYTTDGTSPQTSPTVVNGGNSISLSINPASSLNRGVTPGFVIRASLVKEGFNPSYPINRTFIFHDALRTQSNPGHDWPENDVNDQILRFDMDNNIVTDSRYTNLLDDAFLDVPTISVITATDNLFGASNGIYVNAIQDGRDWERECGLEMINPDGEGFNVNAGIRIRGGYSRNNWYAKHSFRLFFRSEYGDAKLNYPLFQEEGVDRYDKIDLRTAQNYAWYRNDGRNTMVREVFSRDAQREMGQPYTRSRYYHLFLNGMYWGLYQSQERAEARFAADYLGDSSEDYDVVKAGRVDGQLVTEPTDGDALTWNYIYSLATQGFANDARYYSLEGKDEFGNPLPGGEVLVDIDNLIDYMLIIFYSGNFDSPTSSFLRNNGPNNFFAIFNKNDVDKGFKFFCHDSEHSLFHYVASPGTGLYENRVNIGTRTDNMRMTVSGPSKFHPQWLHYKLTANEEYRIRFADRAVKVLTGDGVLTSERGIERMEERQSQFDMAIIAESARWGNGHTKDDNWLPEIESIYSSYFPFRTDITISQLRNANLYPSVDIPEIIYNGDVLYNESYNITSDWEISIENPNSIGTLYYTLNGTDPRLDGGEISSSALNSDASVSMTLSSSEIISARVLDDDEWSPLRQIKFLSDNDDFSNLVLTEIHYNPLDLIEGTDTTSGKNFEFIEFKNIGESALNLSGIVVDSAIYFEFPESTILGPGQFYVVAAKPSKFFEIYGTASSGNYSKTLSNGGEKLIVNGANGAAIIYMVYDDHSPWPEGPDGTGPSMVSLNINPTGDPDNPLYWRTSHFIGGSPFADDYIKPISLEDEIGGELSSMEISIYPNPSRGNLEVEFSDWMQNELIEFYLYQLDGQLVYAENLYSNTSISLSDRNIKAGVYLLKFNSKFGQVTKKLIYTP